jgi:hypothetical protein
MNAHHASTRTITRSHTPTLNTPDKPLRGPWLVVARLSWGAITLINLLIFVFGIPAYAAQLHIICTTDCEPERVTSGNAVALTHLGISLDVYIAYNFAITLFASLVFMIVGAILFWRKSQELIGLLVSLLLITFGCYGSTLELVNALSAAHSGWMAVQLISQGAYIIYLAMGLFFCLFPDGRFVPRWSWLLIGLWFLSIFPFNAPVDSPFFFGNWPPVLFAVLFLLTWGNGIGIQIYRYRYVSRPEQRQQTKWFVFACSIAVGSFILYFALKGLFPAFNQPDSVYQLANATVTTFIFLSIPLALGIAILRYRLWDIDILIRRTLVYGTLTVILTTVYVGLVIGLQTLLRGLISQDNSVIIVISTLVIVTLSQPLRRHIQRIIDRRFYRSKYDAAKTVAAFSVTLRQELDLDLLSKRLVSVVEETMQPEHVSLWLVQRESRPARQEESGQFVPDEASSYVPKGHMGQMYAPLKFPSD